MEVTSNMAAVCQQSSIEAQFWPHKVRLGFAFRTSSGECFQYFSVIFNIVLIHAV